MAQQNRRMWRKRNESNSTNQSSAEIWCVQDVLFFLGWRRGQPRLTSENEGSLEDLERPVVDRLLSRTSGVGLCPKTCFVRPLPPPLPPPSPLPPPLPPSPLAEASASAVLASAEEPLMLLSRLRRTLASAGCAACTCATAKKSESASTSQVHGALSPKH